MSTTWYECKVKYRKLNDSGVQKVVTEPYLVDALSYTEAETRINEEMSAYISEEFKITNIKIANFAEIHPFENSDRWFKSKVSLIAYDEESGKERKTNLYLLVQANDVKEAFDNTNATLNGTTSDYSIPAISESPIMDVFPFFTGEEEQLEKFKPLQEDSSAVEESLEEQPEVAIEESFEEQSETSLEVPSEEQPEASIEDSSEEVVA